MIDGDQAYLPVLSGGFFENSWVGLNFDFTVSAMTCSGWSSNDGKAKALISAAGVVARGLYGTCSDFYRVLCVGTAP